MRIAFTIKEYDRIRRSHTLLLHLLLWPVWRTRIVLADFFKQTWYIMNDHKQHTFATQQCVLLSCLWYDITIQALTKLARMLKMYEGKILNLFPYVRNIVINILNQLYPLHFDSLANWHVKMYMFFFSCFSFVHYHAYSTNKGCDECETSPHFFSLYCYPSIVSVSRTCPPCNMLIPC